jgi:hypothetical protein
MPAGRPLGGRPRLGADHRCLNPPNTEGALVGVVWGEGASGERGPATGTGISGWVERLIHAVWRRLFMRGGEA